MWLVIQLAGCARLGIDAKTSDLADDYVKRFSTVALELRVTD